MIAVRAKPPSGKSPIESVLGRVSLGAPVTSTAVTLPAGDRSDRSPPTDCSATVLGLNGATCAIRGPDGVPRPSQPAKSLGRLAPAQIALGSAGIGPSAKYPSTVECLLSIPPVVSTPVPDILAVA